MLHFKLTTPGSIHHAHGWILLGEVSLKWRKIDIKSDSQENEALTDRQSYLFLVIKILQGDWHLTHTLKLQKSQLWNNCKQHFLSSVLHHGAMFIPDYVSFNERLVPLFCWISSVLQLEVPLAASGEVEDSISERPALYILSPRVTNICDMWHLTPRAVCTRSCRAALGRTLSLLLEH